MAEPGRRGPSGQDDGGLAVVRIKPLGAGVGGGERSAAGASEGAVQAADEGVRVLGGPGRLRDGRLFSYPQHVIAPEDDQEQLYEMFMPQRVDAFLQGINVNIVAYGQTGSGKTHTMFGPPGLMAKAAAGSFGMGMCPEYGLCPRGVLHIMDRLEELKQRPGSTMRYHLTASAVELTCTEGNLCMFEKSTRARKEGRFMQFKGAAGVSLDKGTKPAKLFGMTQVSMDSEESLRALFGAIACRNTAGTGLNDSSSRSHCFVFLNLYALEASSELLRCSRFQFVDLAGSERLKDAHEEGGSIFKNTRAVEGLMTNYSLMILSQRVRELVEARRRGKKAEALVRQSFRTQCDPDLVPLLGESISGVAKTLVAVCLSSAPENAAQSVNALDFGQAFSHLLMAPEEMPSVPVEEARERARELAARDRVDTVSSKWAIIRASQSCEGRQMLEILEGLTRR